MRSSRRNRDRRGTVRPVPVSSYVDPNLETRMRRRLDVSGLRAHLEDSIRSNVQHVSPSGARPVQINGRPMPELFGVQDLREYFTYSVFLIYILLNNYLF